MIFKINFKMLFYTKCVGIQNDLYDSYKITRSDFNECSSIKSLKNNVSVKFPVCNVFS